MRSSNPIPSSLPPQQVSFNKIEVFAKVFNKLFSTCSIFCSLQKIPPPIQQQIPPSQNRNNLPSYNGRYPNEVSLKISQFWGNECFMMFLFHNLQQHINGLSHSPQQQQQQQQQTQQHRMPPQQKPSQMPNGIRPIDKKCDDISKSDRHYPYGVKSLQEPLTNGRRQPYLERPIDKSLDINVDERNSMHNIKNSMAPPMSSNVPNSSSLFSKPFKVPMHHDKVHSAPRPILNHVAPSTPTGVGTGENVEDILKMMKTFSEPLSKLAATPRVELEVQQPSKNHIYATGLPIFRGPINQSEFLN